MRVLSGSGQGESPVVKSGVGWFCQRIGSMTQRTDVRFMIQAQCNPDRHEQLWDSPGREFSMSFSMLLASAPLPAMISTQTLMGNSMACLPGRKRSTSCYFLTRVFTVLLPGDILHCNLGRIVNIRTARGMAMKYFTNLV